MDQPPLPLFARQNRRHFLRNLTGAGVGLVLAGCGGGSGGTSGGGAVAPGGGGGAAPPAGVAPDSLPPVQVRGTVDGAQIGGSGLRVVSVFQADGPVSSGAFQTSVSPNLAQALIVLDADGAARAMVVNVPTEGSAGAPAVDATSTAIALVFMTPGVGTSSATLAAQRIALITAAPGFPALVAALSARLPGMTLAAALAEAEVRAALQAVVDQVPVEFVVTRDPGRLQSERFLGRTAEEQQEINRNGGLWVERDPETPWTRMGVQVNNEGWRFVSLIRQDFDAAGNELRVEVCRLNGSPTAGTPSVCQGINGVSFGSLFTLATFAPGTAVDEVNTVSPEVARSVYWVRGLGNPFHPYNTPIPATVREADFAGIAEGLTVAYYFLFPFFEPFLAVGKSLGLTRADDLEDLFSRTGLLATGLSVQGALNTNDPGNLTLALVDACKDLIALGGTALLAFLAGLAGQAAAGGPAGVVAAATEAIVGVLSSVMSAVNFAKALTYITRVPRYADVDLRIPGARMLEFLGPTGSLTVLDVNELGTMVYKVPEVGLFYRRFGSPPVKLLDEDGEGLLNSKDEVLFQDTARLRHALVRLTSGNTVAMTPPTGSQSPTATGLAGLSNDRKALCSYTREDGQVDLFGYTGSGFAPSGLPEALPGGSLRAVATGRLGALSANWMVGNLVKGSDNYLATFLLESNSWVIRPAEEDGLFASHRYVDINSSNTRLALKYWADGDAFVGWTFHFRILLETQGAGPSVVVATDDVRTGEDISRRFTLAAMAINEDGEVAGLLNDTNDARGPRGMLWSPGGQQAEIKSLLPPNAPAGEWTPLWMRGRFMILERRDDVSGEQGLYLFHRGR